MTSLYLIGSRLNSGSDARGGSDIRVGAHGDVLWLKKIHFLDYDVVFHEELTVFLIRTTPVECPAGGNGMNVERTEDGLFDWIRDGHVILNRVQSPQYEVKQANLVNFKIWLWLAFLLLDRWKR